MKNFKKVLALVLAFAMVLSTMTTAFAATANDGKAVTLNELGLLDGKSTEEFDPALADQASAPEALKLIGTALGWEVDPAATTDFEDVAPWAAPWVAKAVELGVTNGISETEFGSDLIDGQRVVTWFLRALGYDSTEAWENTAELATTAGLTIPAATLRDDVVGVIYEGLMATPVGGEQTLIAAIVAGDEDLTAIAEAAGLIDATLAIESVTAVGVKAVEVKLNKAVADTTTVKVKKGAAIYGTAVTWNDAMNTATVATVINMTAGDYTVEVTTADETLTGTLTVVAEAAATISVTTTEVALQDAVEFEFVVANQYGEDMEVDADDAVTAVAYNVTKGAVVVVNDDDNDGIFELDDLADNATGESYDAEAGDVVRVTLSYLGMTTQANLTVIEVASAAGIDLGAITLADDDTMLNEADGSFTLEYTLLDQYGAETTLSETVKTALPKTIDGIQFISSDDYIIDEIAVDEDGVLTLYIDTNDNVDGDAHTGTAVITAVVNATGSVSNTSIVVNEDPSADAVAINAPTMLVASQDDAFDLAITITDQFGNVLTDVTGLTAEYDDPSDVDVDDNEDTVDTNATLSLSDTDDVTLLTVDLSTRTDADVNDTTSVTINILDSANDTIGTVTFDVEPEAKAYEIKSIDVPTVYEIDSEQGISASDFTTVDQYGRDYEGTVALAYPTNQATDDVDTVIAAFGAIGDDQSGIDVTDTVDDTGVATVEATIDTVTFEFEVTVIAPGDIDSYTMSDLGTIFADTDAALYDGDYTLDVTVNGVDSDGNEVVLSDNVPPLVTTSNAAIASVSGNTVSGKAAGTATISAWIGGEKVASASVTVSEDAPVAQTIEWSDATMAEGAALTTIVDVTDQYGVEVTTDTEVVTLFFASDSARVTAATGVVADTNTAETIEVTVITSTGLSATEDVAITLAP